MKLLKKFNIFDIQTKVTLTQKILILYGFLLVFTVIFTSVFSYIFFQNLVNRKVSEFDINIGKIKTKLEKIYQGKINKIELPRLEELEKNYSNSNLFLEPIKKDFPEYNFKIETIEGSIEIKDKPELIYEKKENRFFLEMSRQVKFSENLPFKSLKLTIKHDYFKLIIISLLLGALSTIFILTPAILFFSRTIIQPITKMSKGAREIAIGNLGYKVSITTNDELGELAGSFNYMSKELHKMKKIRDDLLAVISHELRSPLGRIKGYTELLTDLKLNKNDKDLYFNSILNEIDFLNQMIGEIIEISRLELNKEHLFLEKLDLSTLVEEIKLELELRQVINKDIKYNFTYDSNLFCEIDFEKIKRVFINVLENSAKAKATEIAFSAKKEKDIIKIIIKDNGIGIPEDQLELVFEKFYRVDKSRDRDTGGFGLGLAIAKGIIKEHKGEIYFLKPEEGAMLNIELPLLFENKAPNEKRTASNGQIKNMEN